MTQIWRFRTVNLVWIHWWLWNDAQSLNQHRRGALSFFKVIRQISRSHGTKNRWFGSNLSKITRPVAAIKSLRFALFKVIHLISMSYRMKNQWSESVAAIKSLRFAFFIFISINKSGLSYNFLCHTRQWYHIARINNSYNWYLIEICESGWYSSCFKQHNVFIFCVICCFMSYLCLFCKMVGNGPVVRKTISWAKRSMTLPPLSRVNLASAKGKSFVLHPKVDIQYTLSDANIFSCDQAALWMVQSVRLSVRLFVTPVWLCSHHCIIMKFSWVITDDRSDVHAKGQGQRSKVKVTEVTHNLGVSGP